MAWSGPSVVPPSSQALSSSGGPAPGSGFGGNPFGQALGPQSGSYPQLGQFYPGAACPPAPYWPSGSGFGGYYPAWGWGGPQPGPPAYHNPFLQAVPQPPFPQVSSAEPPPPLPQEPSRGYRRKRRRSPSSSESTQSESEDSDSDGSDLDGDGVSRSAFPQTLRSVCDILKDQLPTPSAQSTFRWSVADVGDPTSDDTPLLLPPAPGIHRSFEGLQRKLTPTSLQPDASVSLPLRGKRKGIGTFLPLTDAGVSVKQLETFPDSSFPLKPPEVEDDIADLSDKASYSFSPDVVIPFKTACSLDEGTRRMLAAASFGDWFSAAAIRLCRAEEPLDRDQVLSLLLAHNRLNCDVLRLASWSLANLTLARRDAFLRQSSPDLPKDRKEWLRCQSLTAGTLFDGKVEQARQACRSRRQDRVFSKFLSGKQSKSSAAGFSSTSKGSKARKSFRPKKRKTSQWSEGGKFRKQRSSRRPSEEQSDPKSVPAPRGGRARQQ